MQEVLANPLVRFLLTLVSGRLVDVVLNTPRGRAIIDGISGAQDRSDHEAIVRDYAALAATLAINYLYRPPEAERSQPMPLIERGKVNWQRVLEVLAELLLVLGPLLKLAADYGRNRQGVTPDQARG